MARQLEDWVVGTGDLAICGGANGADILFAEICRDRGARILLLLPFPIERFIQESVEIPGTRWSKRFRDLAGDPRCEVRIQDDHLGPLPPGKDPFERNNEWLLQTCLEEAQPGEPLALLVWDGKSGEGTGGTAHFHDAAVRLGLSTIAVINPEEIPMPSFHDKLKETPQKKLLALDGGGIRGVITLEVLAKIESVLQEKLGRGDDFVLAEYFDYVAGTSTGAIIATCVSLGMRVEAIQNFYLKSGPAMFDRASLRYRYLHHKFEDEKLKEKLKEVIGADTTLGSDKLRTLLMMVMRNATTDSPWPVSNNPKAMFNCEPDDPHCNLKLPLWQLVRASTAAPVYFPPELIKVGDQEFIFVDGGITMYNNPAFQLFLMATLEPYSLEWPTGEDKMLVISLGTGMSPDANAQLDVSDLNLVYNAKSLAPALMFAALNEQDLLCRTFGKCLAGDPIDLEVGDLIGKRGPLSPKLFTYARYNAELSRQGLDALGLHDVDPAKVQQLDSIEFIGDLQRVGQAVAGKVKPEHFAGF